MADGRILVVDDEPQFLVAVQSFLENSGFEVIPGTSCRQAEDIYNSAKPDAVVMDYSLGDGNAHEILPRLRASDPSIPIIIMTGLSGQFTRFAGFESGGNDFITKPVTPKALLSKIKELLEPPAETTANVPA